MVIIPEDEWAKLNPSLILIPVKVLSILDMAESASRGLDECEALQIHRLWYKYLDKVVKREPLMGVCRGCMAFGGWVPSGNTTVVKLLGIRSYLMRIFSMGFCNRTQHSFSLAFPEGLMRYDSSESLDFSSLQTLCLRCPGVPLRNPRFRTAQGNLDVTLTRQKPVGVFSVSEYKNLT